ncbi:MAG TPA: sigma-70 family RNA polymerase sigma factor [Actinomycetota bacterium]|nr:sigma-70 family RNA polymerase sigma factor [Actinomycetota bacterium]
MQSGTDRDLDLLDALRAGDDDAFMELVERYQAMMLRIAAMFVPSRAVAEEVVQETWLGVLQGIDRFEGRSSFRTWLFRILVNIAKTRGQRERRSVPFSSLLPGDPEESAVDPDRFQPATGDLPGHWVTFPAHWEQAPEERLLAGETRGVVEGAIEGLPPAQATVIRLRDVLGWSSQEVCNALDISETNQRVLLHRARSKVRRALERYLTEEMVET